MIRVLAIGKLKDRRLTDLAADYERRIRPLARLEVIELKDQDPEREAKQLLNRLGPPDGHELVIALDERGEPRESRGLAKLLGAHGSITFLISSTGGAPRDSNRS